MYSREDGASPEWIVHYNHPVYSIESHYVVGLASSIALETLLWHDHLGYLGRAIMHNILKVTHMHPLNRQLGKIQREFRCQTCSLGKLIMCPSHADHLDTLWYWLMVLLGGHMCAF